MFTSYEVDNDRRFRRALSSARRRVGNLTTPLILISKDFYKSQKAIFQLQSSGKYPDFKNEKSKRQKEKKVGFAYPLLKRSGKLEASLVNPSDPNAINLIVNKAELFIGTSVDYGIYHQSDAPRRKIPLRKFLFIGPESSFATSDQQGRPKRWSRILRKHVVKKMDQIARPK